MTLRGGSNEQMKAYSATVSINCTTGVAFLLWLRWGRHDQ